METTAKAGEKVPFVWHDSAIEKRKEVIKVAPPCDNKTGGSWYCTTHDIGWCGSFHENADHLDKRGPHHLVWVCRAHGVEQP